MLVQNSLQMHKLSQNLSTHEIFQGMEAKIKKIPRKFYSFKTKSQERKEYDPNLRRDCPRFSPSNPTKPHLDPSKQTKRSNKSKQLENPKEEKKSESPQRGKRNYRNQLLRCSKSGKVDTRLGFRASKLGFGVPWIAVMSYFPPLSLSPTKEKRSKKKKKWQGRVYESSNGEFFSFFFSLSLFSFLFSLCN